MTTASLAFAPGTLLRSLRTATGRALATGALRSIETDRHFIEQGGVRFLVRSVSSLARRDRAQIGEAGKIRRRRAPSQSLPAPRPGPVRRRHFPHAPVPVEQVQRDGPSHADRHPGVRGSARAPDRRRLRGPVGVPDRNRRARLLQRRDRRRGQPAPQASSDRAPPAGDPRARRSRWSRFSTRQRPGPRSRTCRACRSRTPSSGWNRPCFTTRRPRPF